MKQQLKLIIKQVIAEELQQEGKGLGRALALGALLGFGGAKLGSHPEKPEASQTQATSDVSHLAEMAKTKVIPSILALAEEGDEGPVRLARNPLLIQIKNVSARDIGLEDLQRLNRLIKQFGISTEETEEFSDMLAAH